VVHPHRYRPSTNRLTLVQAKFQLILDGNESFLFIVTTPQSQQDKDYLLDQLVMMQTELCRALPSAASMTSQRSINFGLYVTFVALCYRVSQSLTSTKRMCLRTPRRSRLSSSRRWICSGPSARGNGLIGNIVV
jgi:hypothetical protein